MQNEISVYYRGGVTTVNYTLRTMNRKYPNPPRVQISWFPRPGMIGAVLRRFIAGKN